MADTKTDPYWLAIIDEANDYWADIIVEAANEAFGLTVENKRRVRQQFVERVQAALAAGDEGVMGMQAEGYTEDQMAEALVASMQSRRASL